MTKAYKLVGGEKTDNSKKFVVWATCPVHALTILKIRGYRYDFKIYRLSEADHIRRMEMMTWESYLAMEKANARSTDTSTDSEGAQKQEDILLQRTE